MARLSNIDKVDVCLQVFLSSTPLVDLAASFKDIAKLGYSDMEHLEDFEGSDSASDSEETQEDLEADLTSDVHNEQAAAAASRQDADAKPSQGSQTVGSDAVQPEQLLSVRASDEEGDELGGSATLIVRKGQQLQELLVDGIISREQLKQEVEQIVSFMLCS